MTIPLISEGTKILMKTPSPTQRELDNCQHIELTSLTEWNPQEVCLSELQVEAPSDWVVLDEFGNYTYQDPTSDEAVLHSIDPSLTDLDTRVLAQAQLGTPADNYNVEQDVPQRRTFISNDRHSRVSHDVLAERFAIIGTERAKATMRVTTQRGLRSAILPLSRRYRADRMYLANRLNGKFATDLAYFKVKSLHQNIAAQIYSHKCGFMSPHPIPRVDGENIGNTLSEFISDYGIPDHLTFDGAAAQVGSQTRLMKLVKKNEINWHVSAPRRPNQNPAEGSIRELKKKFYRIKLKKGVSDRLWDYLVKWVCEINNVTVNSSRYAGGRTPMEIITGVTPDITEYLDFGFYDWEKYKANAGLAEYCRKLAYQYRATPFND